MTRNTVNDLYARLQAKRAADAAEKATHDNAMVAAGAIAVFAVPVMIAVVFALTAVPQGFVAAGLWRWFFAPLGLPTIGLWHAAGITMAARFIVGARNGKTEDRGLWKDVLISWLLSAVVFGIGWVVRGLAFGW